MRHLREVAVLTCVHTAVTGALLFVVFSGGMARFDTGAPTPPLERVADAALRVLSLPLLPAVARLPVAMQPQGFPGEHLVFLANGLIWAVCIVSLWTWNRKRRSAAESAPGAKPRS